MARTANPPTRALERSPTSACNSLPASECVTLFLCGDVMLGRGIDQVLPRPCDPQLYESSVKSAVDYVMLATEVHGPIPRPAGVEYVWGDALGELERRQPDLRIINLETSITTYDVPDPKGINYRMHPQHVDCLAAACIDCCVLANNHVLDWGQPGLIRGSGSRHPAGSRRRSRDSDLWRPVRSSRPAA